ncbi:MAG: bifunctional UDP-N-acetylmuramoyl-tripeptide:D-alanyl-D-alanine ligase/alanine racemase [Bacteroidales bacterium]|nr:bifunctional UDP-N-acetylmuramoyl-tripeptide:D-alanyl-D-alanine ligase/alanine racemase [Bacteroidales bacterium]
MIGYTLKQISEITKGYLVGDESVIINSVEIDSRQVIISSDSIFIAISGKRHDGHDFIEELIDKGISNFIVEVIPRLNLKLKPINFIKVEDSIDALQCIASYHRRHLKMSVIAITGSNGKTVVKEWLAGCLSSKHLVSRSPKSYNSQIGVPISVLMLNENAEWAILEAGISQPGEMHKLKEIITPDYGIFTNIGQAHQENFDDLKQKASEKLKLFSSIKYLYYCRDHEIIHSVLSTQNSISDSSRISWSRKNSDSYLFIRNQEKNTDKTVINLCVEGGDHTITIPFTDDASIENCMHIACFLFHNRFTIDYIQETLSKLTPVAMRLELLRGIKNSTLINDTYNSDINSLKIALDYLATQSQNANKAVILSDIKQTGRDADELYKEVFQLINSYKPDTFIAIGKNISSALPDSDNTRTYINTEEFLSDLQNIEISNHAILVKGARDFEFERIISSLAEKKHTTQLEINLNNLTYNLNYFRSLLKPQTWIMVMVKALTYGSGSHEIANLLQHQKVDYLGVAFTDEGIALRKAGIHLPILVMSPTENEYEDIIDYQLEPEIFSLKGLRNLSLIVNKKQLSEYPFHIKLDTGMHRLGFMPKEVPELLEILEKCSNLKVKAVFSHLAVSDNKAEDNFTHEQINTFNTLYESIAEAVGNKPKRHILNSAGIERFPEAHFDMVRLGIGLHGISSAGKKLRTVSTLRSRICQIKIIPPNETIGYNRRGKLNKIATIGIIPIGYADGLNRKLGNGTGYVICNKKKAPFVGDICMDLSMIDLTGIDALEGDEVIIFGEENPIRNLAEQTGTIPYEILTNVSARVNRIYVNE